MTEPLCRAPWVTIYREQDGTVSPCCESQTPYQGVHASQTNQEIFNHPEVEKFKQQLLDGVWPDRCVNCKTQESRNQRSHRRVISHKRYAPDYDVNEFKMRFLDHRSSNICNFSCKMCSEHLSSTHAIIKKSQGYAPEFPKNGIIEMPTTVKNVVDNIHDLKHLQFAGGEPLLMDSTWDLIDWAVDSGVAPNISVGMITNGSLLSRNEDRILDKLKQFKIAHLTVSVDALGDGHNYWRHKGTWAAVEKNLEQMIAQREPDKFEICLRTTIGWPTAWRAREVFEKYSHQVDAHFTGFINGPPWWSITQLDQEEIDRLAEYYKDWKDPHNLFSAAKSARTDENMSQAKKFLQIADKYHNNSFTESFPEHKDFYEKYIVPQQLPA